MKYIATTQLLNSVTHEDVMPGQLIELDEERATVLLEGGHILPEGTPLFVRADESLVYAYVDGSWRKLGWWSDFGVEGIRLPYGGSFPDMTPAAPIEPEAPEFVEVESKKRSRS